MSNYHDDEGNRRYSVWRDSSDVYNDGFQIKGAPYLVATLAMESDAMPFMSLPPRQYLGEVRAKDEYRAVKTFNRNQRGK